MYSAVLSIDDGRCSAVRSTEKKKPQLQNLHADCCEMSVKFVLFNKYCAIENEILPIMECKNQLKPM